MTQNRYWRSLDELSQTDEFKQFVEREFPDLEAGGGLDSVGRRRFMQLMGASMALAGAGCWEKEYILPHVRRPHGTTPGQAQSYASALDFGGVGFPVSVTSFDGRPIKVDGHPKHPTLKGGSDPYLQASILALYDPDRSTAPRSRSDQGYFSATLDDFKKEFTKVLSAAGDGSKLRVLSRATASPSVKRKVEAVKARFPNSKVLEFESFSYDNARLGSRMAFGRPYRTQWDFRRARVIVALDDDLFGDHPDRLRLSREWAEGRDPDGNMNRLYSIESRHSLTGAAADHRLPLRSAWIKGFLLAVENRVREQLGLAPAGPVPRGGYLNAPKIKKWVEQVSQDLVANRQASVLAVGPGQPPEAHAVAHRLNAALGNVGQTTTYTVEHGQRRPSHFQALRQLSQEMNRGQVDTLVILGGNPVYDAPGDVDFAAALAKVPNTVHVSSHFDETAEHCLWHVPHSHDLESWGDVRSYDGTYTVAQPLIRPLYASLSTLETLALMVGRPSTETDLERVRTTFAAIAGIPMSSSSPTTTPTPATEAATAAAAPAAPPDPTLVAMATIPLIERRWRKVVSDGYLDKSAFAPANPTLRTFSAGRVSTAGDPAVIENGRLELTFYQDGKVYDGRFCNSGWLQEQPDHMCKLTWDNAALMSPKTADSLGVRNGDVVTLTLAEQSGLAMPVYVLPGQATGSVAVALGYGRSRAGRVGGDPSQDVAPVGVDVSALRRTEAAWFTDGLTVTRTDRTHKLASTQNHWAIDDAGAAAREKRAHHLVREATLEEYREKPDFAPKMDHHPPLLSLFTERQSPGNKWGLAIDLAKCTGCTACSVACSAENNVPVVGKERVLKGREMHWIRIDRYFQGDGEDPEVVGQPMACQQCENAPCEQVCPVAATVHSEEGLNDMVYNRCIGTRYCANNCPYKVRRFNYFNYTNHLKEPENQSLKMMQNPEVTIRFRGVMEKCTYCTQRISKARQVARIEKRDLRDGDIVTACEEACPTGAITFGDLNDPNSRVSKLHALKRSYAVLAELNVKPRTQYLAKVRNPNPNLSKS